MTEFTLDAWLKDATVPLLADGAMGTMLHARGVGPQACYDELNCTQPALVAEVHRAYIDAGAQIVQTNTWGANRYKLALHGLAEQVADINHTAVELARRVIDASFKDVLLAGDVGPLGVRLVPYGRVLRSQAREAFREQIAALVAAGVDMIVIETMTDLRETLDALKAARQVADLPVVTTMMFTRDDLTLLGDAPEAVARQLWDAGASLVGVNCSGGPQQLLRILQRMRAAVPEGRFWVKPNAGWPEKVEGRTMYPASPEYFGEYAWLFHSAGASVVGGCCGTTPGHIAALRAALDAGPPDVIPQLREVVQSREPVTEPHPAGVSRLAQRFAAGHFAIAVEMSPPRGLATKELLTGASLLAEAGADVINVADCPMARMRMSPWAVCHLIQDKVDVETTLHFPTRGRNILRVQGDLLAAHVLGVRNVFVVMGDPTSIGDYPEATDDFDIAPSGLIKLIKQGFNAGVDHAGAEIGRPTTFFVGGALNLAPKNVAREHKVLRRKLRGGVDFFLTQPVYDPAAARAFLDTYAAEYGPLEKPILAGVLPLYSMRHARFLHNEVPGITISPEIFARLEAAGDRARYEGVKIAIELVEKMRGWADGIYIMPAFKRYDLAAEIVEACRGMCVEGRDSV